MKSRRATIRKTPMASIRWIWLACFCGLLLWACSDSDSSLPDGDREAPGPEIEVEKDIDPEKFLEGDSDSEVEWERDIDADPDPDPDPEIKTDPPLDLESRFGGDMDYSFKCDPEDIGPTWLDPDTGLMWQRYPPGHFYLRANHNGDAEKLCHRLNIWRWGGYDDWRPPTISELRSLIWGCPLTESRPNSPCKADDSCCYPEKAGCFCQEKQNLDPICPEGKGPVNGVYIKPAFCNETMGRMLVYTTGVDYGCKDDGYLNLLEWVVNFWDASILVYDWSTAVRCVRDTEEKPWQGGPLIETGRRVWYPSWWDEEFRADGDEK